MAIEKWHVYRANLDPVVGSEQGKSRPVLVVSENLLNDLLNCVNVVPLTSRKPGRTVYPNEVFLATPNGGVTGDSIVLCHQIRTIDKKRLSLKFGEITVESVKDKVLDAICFQLGIER